MGSLHAHTVTEFIFQLLSGSNCYLSMPKRGFCCDLSPAYIETRKTMTKTNASPRRHIRLILTCASNLNKLRREGHMKKNNTGTIIPTAKSGFLRTYNLVWLQTTQATRRRSFAVFHHAMSLLNFAPLALVNAPPPGTCTGAICWW